MISIHVYSQVIDGLGRNKLSIELVQRTEVSPAAVVLRHYGHNERVFRSVHVDIVETPLDYDGGRKLLGSAMFGSSWP